MPGLSPEQFGWSVMQATGVLAAYRAQAEWELFGRDGRLAAIVGLDDRRRRMRAELVEDRVHGQLRGSLQPFVAQFAAAAGQPQDGGQATVHQALFLSNGEPVRSWLEPSGTNLTARLGAMTDDGAVADELYLAVLTRRPTAEERAEVAAYLKGLGPEGRPRALRDLAWSLLASSEFRFRH
jgi:hypothetical protein